MDTITTTADLMTCNGSATPVTVDLTPSAISLIVAAPELLEALQWMVANDETNEGDEPVDYLNGRSWNEENAYWIDGLNRARAAIAKALGTES